MWGYLQKKTHQGHLIEASFDVRAQNSYLAIDKSKVMTKLHPCREIDGCKDKTFVQEKVGAKF
jgi:hypothetical protein